MLIIMRKQMPNIIFFCKLKNYENKHILVYNFVKESVFQYQHLQVEKTLLFDIFIRLVRK